MKTSVACDYDDMPDVLECRSVEHYVDNLHDAVPAPVHSGFLATVSSNKKAHAKASK